jgi:hypothetical protein
LFDFSDYFDKRAAVVTCYIISTNPKCAIIEFEYEKCVKKLLETPVIRLHGMNLSLSKVISQSTPVLTSSAIDNEEIDQLLETTGPKFPLHLPPIRNEPCLPAPTRIEPFLPVLPRVEQQSNSILNLPPLQMNTESVE